jgi:menaquinone-dependent protoporphyrinogen oxidase
MKILIAYATTDGQTRKIARRACDTLADAGVTVEMIPAEDAADIDLGRFDGAVLAGSVHIGGFQKALRRFAQTRAADLNAMPTLFLPVSLSAAGQDAEDWAGLEKIMAEFREATGWVPGRIEHVAGAFRFTEYDPFRGWAMRRIAAKKDPAVTPPENREYTDWGRLAEVLADWRRHLEPPRRARA